MALSFCCTSAIPPQHQVNVIFGSKNSLQNVKNLIQSIVIPSKLCSPHLSLQHEKWVKLICDASFEDGVDIRNLSLIYTLAGVDCIDCVADPSVVNAVNEGIETARDIISIRRPWVMISVNDDEDIHFHKSGIYPFIVLNLQARLKRLERLLLYLEKMLEPIKKDVRSLERDSQVTSDHPSSLRV